MNCIEEENNQIPEETSIIIEKKSFTKSKSIFSFMNNPQIKIFIQTANMYILWIIFHYAASHIYASHCTPKTIFGFFMSPFLINMPQCVATRWFITKGAAIIDNMWVVIGLWVIPKILIAPEQK